MAYILVQCDYAKLEVSDTRRDRAETAAGEWFRWQPEGCVAVCRCWETEESTSLPRKPTTQHLSA